MKRVIIIYVFCAFCFIGYAQTINNASFEIRKSEILHQWNKLRPTFSGDNMYDYAPSNKQPFEAGKVNNVALKDGVNMLNFFRFLTGLPADVQLNTEFTDLAQHGSVLNAAWGRIAHSQSQPAGMSDAFYSKAVKGIGSSNLHQGESSINEAVISWMDDSDNSNIDRLGHRRWILNPRMLYTGFGIVDKFLSMYSFDNSRDMVDYQYIAFPSGAAYPADFFGGHWAWNVSLNPNLYQKPIKGEVIVTLTERASGKKWAFGKNDNDGYFNIETSNFGVPICIIFRPQNIVNYTGTYSVAISGLKNKSGESVSLNYHTTFFEMEVEASAADFDYVISDNSQSITITKYKGLTNKVIIPQTIKNLPVRKIGKGCFTYAKISMITLPNTLTEIEDNAFWYSGITSIVIPQNVRRIGKQAFSFCSELVSINLPDTPVNIDSFAFYGCSKLTTINLSSNIEKLGYGVFQDCTKLNRDIHADILQRFGDAAFGR